MDDQYYMIDYNLLPYKLRFTSCYKIFNEIQSYIEILDKVVEQKTEKLERISKIKFILEEHFQLIGKTLKDSLDYVSSIDCQLENRAQVNLTSTIKDRINCFIEDEKEYSSLQNLKQVVVIMEKIPQCWRSLTWNKKLNTSDDLESCNDYVKKTSLVRSIEPNDCNMKEESEIDLVEIYRLFHLIENRIELLKQKLCMVDEAIGCLIINIKENLKVFVRLENEITKIQNLSEESKNILAKVLNTFSIDEKLDFFSTSPDAHRLILSEKIFKLEISSNGSN